MHRHTLKKTNQAQRKRISQEPTRKPEPPVSSVLRSARKLSKNRWFWLGLVMLVTLVGLGLQYYKYFPSSLPLQRITASSPAGTISNGSQQQAPTVLPSSGATPTWQTVQTMNGGNTGASTQKTRTFTVTGKWQMTWNCQGQHGVDDWLYIAIYYTNGKLYNAGAQVTCIAAKMVVGSVQEADGGTFYLTIDANTDWTLLIQEQKA